MTHYLLVTYRRFKELLKDRKKSAYSQNYEKKRLSSKMKNNPLISGQSDGE